MNRRERLLGQAVGNSARLSQYAREIADSWICESCGRTMSGAYTVDPLTGRSLPIDKCLLCRFEGVSNQDTRGDD